MAKAGKVQRNFGLADAANLAVAASAGWTVVDRIRATRAGRRAEEIITGREEDTEANPFRLGRVADAPYVFDNTLRGQIVEITREGETAYAVRLPGTGYASVIMPKQYVTLLDKQNPNYRVSLELPAVREEVEVRALTQGGAMRKARARMRGALKRTPKFSIERQNPETDVIGQSETGDEGERRAYYLEAMNHLGEGDYFTTIHGLRVFRAKGGESFYPFYVEHPDNLDTQGTRREIADYLASLLLPISVYEQNPQRNRKGKGLASAVVVNPSEDVSKGHVAFIGEYEYFIGQNGDLFRAPFANPLDIHGYRQGARFESTPAATPLALKVARDNFARFAHEYTFGGASLAETDRELATFFGEQNPHGLSGKLAANVSKERLQHEARLYREEAQTLLKQARRAKDKTRRKELAEDARFYSRKAQEREREARQNPNTNLPPSTRAKLNKVSRMFHGESNKHAGRVRQMPVSNHSRARNFSRAGSIPAIKLVHDATGRHSAPNHVCAECAIEVNPQTSMLGISTGKRVQLLGKGVHAAGRRLKAALDKMNPEELAAYGVTKRGESYNLGRADTQWYTTHEKHSANPDPDLVNYYHEWAEETKRMEDKPFVILDEEGMLYLSGGNHTVTERGIEN